MTTFLAGVLVFTTYILLLVAVLLLAKRWLVARGDVHIVINGDEPTTLSVATGDTLLNTLSRQGIFVSSACGGKGTCGTCKVKVETGGGSIHSTELPYMTYKEACDGVRLACQVKVKQDMSLELPSSSFNAHEWECRVRSNHNVATFIKELVLELPAGESIPFHAGSYIMVRCPSYQLSYADFDIKPFFHDSWSQLDMWKYSSQVDEPTQRAYSLANYPGEKGVLIFNVRIATPPPDHPDAPPGMVSSYIFNLKPGDRITVAGPFGDFFARDSDAEMVFIGGGAGMAPMRSHILQQLKGLHTNRKISFWYGARSLCEAFYVEEFDSLAQEYDNFDWTLVLSAPLPEDEWDGPCGFIHQVLYDLYLASHSAPEEAEYYLCGPPPMIDACVDMITALGVEPENILFDKFG